MSKTSIMEVLTLHAKQYALHELIRQIQWIIDANNMFHKQHKVQNYYIFFLFGGGGCWGWDRVRVPCSGFLEILHLPAALSGRQTGNTKLFLCANKSVKVCINMCVCL